MSASTPAKDVIYIDVDDEITAIIDKVRDSQSKIVALVLPKRATTLQSVVNMKLLKRSADTENKHLVLITSEAGLLPLAANIGLYVAKNLQSKPEIPAVPTANAIPEDTDEALSMDDKPVVAGANPIASQLNGQAPIGDLAKGSLPPSALDDAINLDNTTPAKPSVTPAVGGGFGGKPPKGSRNKKLAVPNFDKFRMWILLGVVAVILLIVGIIFAVKVMPRASISVKTDSTAINANLDLTLNTSATDVNEEAGVVPAKSQQIQKTVTQQASATGEKNNGKKASGAITASMPCGEDLPKSVPAGSAVTSGGKTYVTQTAIALMPKSSGNKCQFSGSTTIVAQQQGASYNLSSGADLAIAGRSDLDVATSGITGGSDEIVKIVQQSDIDSAKQKLAAQDSNAIKQQLQSQLSSAGYYPVPATFTPGEPKTTTSVGAGDQADSVTVTQVYTYTMLGAKQEDLKKVVAAAVDDKIDKSKQSITDYGLGKAAFTSQNPSSGSVAMNVTAVAGPDIKVNEIKQKIAGSKSGDAKKIIESYPGVTDVTVDYSPFWVNKIPGDLTKITVTIEEPENQTKAN